MPRSETEPGGAQTNKRQKIAVLFEGQVPLSEYPYFIQTFEFRTPFLRGQRSYSRDLGIKMRFLNVCTLRSQIFYGFLNVGTVNWTLCLHVKNCIKC